MEIQFFQCIAVLVLLYSGETWDVMKQHISPLTVFQMNCLRRICGISLRDHLPKVDILNRCNTLSVESQLQGKTLRWLGHVFRMPTNILPKKLLFGEVKGLRPPGCPRSNLMRLRCMTVKTVELVDLIEMRKTDCFGETRLVPHIPSSS